MHHISVIPAKAGIQLKPQRLRHDDPCPRFHALFVPRYQENGASEMQQTKFMKQRAA